MQEESSYPEEISKVQMLLKGKEEIQTKQETIFSEEEMKQQEKDQFKILGQVFDTYWILSFADKMYFVDQHAAHEKVMYERFIKQLESQQLVTQNVNPPIVITFTAKELETFELYHSYFQELGFVVENFGFFAFVCEFVHVRIVRKHLYYYFF